MRKFLIAAVAISGLMFAGANLRAEDKAEKGESWDGILIDKACGEGQKDEASAAKHPKACAMKEACAKSGYGLYAGDKFIKFDEEGDKLAKEYLAKEEHTTKVLVHGELDKDGKMVKVTAIEPQEEKK